MKTFALWGLLALLLAMRALPASAQLTPHWEITYSSSGSKTATVSLGGVSVSSITSAWPTTYTGNGSTAPPYVRTPNLAPNQTAYVQTAGMLNAKLRWVYQDGNTQLAPNPPPIIFIREFSSAGWSYYGAMSDATGNGTADNGKGGSTRPLLRI